MKKTEIRGATTQYIIRDIISESKDSLTLERKISYYMQSKLMKTDL